MKRLMISLAIALIMSCQAKLPGDILGPEKMKPIVFDLIKADVFADNYVLKDTTLKSKEQHFKLYAQVFAIHKVSRNAFYKSMVYYQKHPDLNKALFDSISSLGSRQKDGLFKSTYGKPTPKAP